MKFELFIARRYLLRGRKNSFISIISLVSIIGITIGVAALIVAMSLINGFQDDIKKKLLNSTSHILLDSLDPEGFLGYEKTIDKILETFPNRVQSAQSVIYGTVLVKGNTRNGSGAIFKGLDFNKKRIEEWLLDLNNRDLPKNKNEIILGKDLARKLFLRKGDTCLLIIPRGTLSPT